METTKIIYPIQSEDGERIINVELEVTIDIAAVIDESDKKERALYVQDKRHIDSAPYTEGEMEQTMRTSERGLEDLVMDILDREILRAAIESLPAIQRRRLKAYYFGRLTFKQIAAKEHAAYSSVYDSIVSGKKKLKTFFGM